MNDPWTAEEKEATRRRLTIWQDASSALEEQRWRDLRSMTDEQALLLTKALLSRPVKRKPNSTWSGLVEQQALFRRLLPK